MSYYTGTHGRMIIRTGSDQSKDDKEEQQLHVRNWQVTTSISQLDATTLGDTDKVPVNGIRTTRGSCQILYYRERGKGSSIKNLVEKMVKVRENPAWDGDRPGEAGEARQVFLHLYVLTDGNSQRGYKLQANITSFAWTVSTGDIVTGQIQFQAVGAPLDFAP